MIAVIDYGVNNLASVRNALAVCSGEVTVTSDPKVISRADGVVLPGIGAAGAGMEALRRRDLVAPIRGATDSGRPFLAICLGMQLLFESSEEGDVGCLGIVPGVVSFIRTTLKVPQIGWNQVETQPELPMWAGLTPDPYFYFVHSYVCVPTDPSLSAGQSEYGAPFCSAIARGPLWATQFHPERSGATGLRVIRNFVQACNEERLAHGGAK